MDEFSSKRLIKAEHAIKAAERDIKANDSESATSRGYYAMFYIAEALLNKKEVRIRHHGGVHGAFGKAFAKTKEIDPKFHGWLLGAYDKRIISDYGVEEGDLGEDAKIILKQAREFLEVAKDYLGK